MIMGMSDPDFVSLHGNREGADHQILRTVVGSGVHGLAIEGTDDHDEMGVYIETVEMLTRVHEPKPHLTGRTVPEGHRSRPGDTDLVLYSLRKYLGLAVKGNPTVLLPLFAPPGDVLVTTVWGNDLRGMASAFLSQSAIHRFLGYLRSQRDRMNGGRAGGRGMPNRPELVAAHGFDTKYASHALRLGLQAREVATSGTLTLPMPEPDRSLVLSVKTGQFSLAAVNQMIDDIEAELVALLDTGRTVLPRHADLAAINAWSTETHLDYWDSLRA